MAKKLLDTIKFLLRLISCVSICLLVVIVFMQVINRNFFDHSFTWVEEVASMAMVFITYLGAAMATINNGNTRIDFFIRKLPTPVYNAFELLDDVICIGVLVIVSTIAYKQMLTSWSMQTPALRLPQGINYLAILLGCVLMIVFYVVWAILHLMKLMGRDTSKEEEELNR